MSVSVVKYPHGFSFSSTENAITIANDGGSASVAFTGHGLSSGDYVYLFSDVEQYNGIWYVDPVDANHFKFREYSSASNVSYISAATGIAVKCYNTTAWVPVHLPIVFKLLSTLWPINGADTARTVSSFANANGYTALTLSGTLHTGSTVLEKVVISGTASLDGVYTIIRWISASSIVIDLVYNASNSFTGGTVQYYYNNYHVIVRVKAGVIVGSWTSLNPEEQLAELKCIPDASGIITVNVNEIIKSKLSSLSNNLALASLPNNIDFAVAFKISFAESYDDSNGYTVEQYTGSYTESDYSYAVNAKMPFKTRGAGLGAYLMGLSGSTLVKTDQKFLTLFSSPVLTPDKYFDISVLIQANGFPYKLRRQIYKNGVLKDVLYDTFTSDGAGVFRLPIEQSGWTEDRQDITLMLDFGSGFQVVTETLTIEVNNDCSNQDFYLTWLNYLGGFDYWNFTARKTYSLEVTDSRVEIRNIFPDWPNSYGESGDTIRRQTFRQSKNSIRVNSQYVSLAQLEAIKWIIVSPLVQIVTTQTDRRTIIVNPESIQLYKDQDDLYSISFTISYTDDLPAQSL